MTASLKKLTAGDGLTYYTRQVAVLDATDRGRASLNQYYSEKGERPGVWAGRGLADVDGLAHGSPVSEEQMRALFGEGRHPNADLLQAEMLARGDSAEEVLRATRLGQAYPQHAEEIRPMAVAIADQIREWNRRQGAPIDAPVPAAVRARIRTEVARASFQERHGRTPDERELAGHLARELRPPAKACAGYDFTFTPVKSVSVLWAVGNDQVTKAVEDAHDAAVREALAWIEDNALFTRRGARGVRQVEVSGALAAMFQHRDSRDGDPNLHTHVVIANKVRDPKDGTWLAVDGSPLHKLAVCISERYNTALEVELNQRLGLTFAERYTDRTKRPIREVAGIHEDVLAATSSRRKAIDARRAELGAIFQARHGRPPTAVEAIKIAQQANLETRQDKHEPRSFAEQKAAWRGRIGSTVGGDAGIDQMLAEVRAHCAHRADSVPDAEVSALVESVVDAMEASRARFQINHIRAEAERQARGQSLSPEATARLTQHLITATLERCVPLTMPADQEVPHQLRRSDGRSQYERAWSDTYTTVNVMAAEEGIMAAARRTDGRRCSRIAADAAIRDVAANSDGPQLNVGQQALVREMVTSGARVQLALAPAGSGKTTAMRVLSKAWTSAGGTVLGLAPSAVAADELRRAFGDQHVDTLAKLTWELTSGSGERPPWVDEIDSKTLIVIDEAGMTSTRDLWAVVDHAIARGASVRLVGDDQQLAAVEAGGILRDLKLEVGAISLTELVRFKNPEESAATLAMRDGDVNAIGFYLDNGRLHLHDESTIAQAVYEGWKRDVDAGLKSLMLAYSNDLADELNRKARADRVAAGVVGGPEVALRGGQVAAAGDVIVSRKNRRTLRLSNTDFVRNGDSWEVRAVHRDGSITAVHQKSGRQRELPSWYVAEHVDLGYARTVHTSQGTTVQTSHTALNGEESRQLAYTAATRGELENHLYVFAGGDGDQASLVDPDVIRPLTAAEILARVVERDGAQVSARTAAREAQSASTLLAAYADTYSDAVAQAALQQFDDAQMQRISVAAEQLCPGLTQAPAWDSLLGQLAIQSAAGGDPVDLLTQAVLSRELDTARDPAAVLHWRLDPDGRYRVPGGPLPWVTGVPLSVAQDRDFGPYLSRLATQVRHAADAVSAEASATPAEAVPRWAIDLTSNRELMSEVAVWRAAHQVPVTDPEPLGETPPITVAEREYLHKLADRTTEVLGPKHDHSPAWAGRLLENYPDLQADSFWPVFVRRVDQVARAKVNVEPLIVAALARGPLPDEHAASALWYRLAGTIGPTTAVAGDATTNRLRPPWTDDLVPILGQETVSRVLRDPYWPSLVAAVTDAERHGMAAGAVLADAARAIGPNTIGQAGGCNLEDLTVLLTWRITSVLQDRHDEPVDEVPTDPEVEDWLASQVLVDGGWQQCRPIPNAPEPFLAPLVDAPPEHHDETQSTGAGEAIPMESRDLPDASAGTSPQRIVELNQMAASFWAAQYAGSDAAGYMASRFHGDDLSSDPRFSVGYAPASWTALVDHLRAQGVSDQEMVDASLASWSRRGTLYDFFRDRVMLGIKDADGQLVGFSGRIMPTHTPADDPSRPPQKYLNPRTTAAFHKGRVLFGLAENAEQLRAGAAPVLTEGPLDAIAVTLAGDGKVVGLAPSGTALTQAQAELLTMHAPTRISFGDQRIDHLVVVATDTDAAGQAAAAKDFWLLQQAGADTRSLVLPAGPGGTKEDPAGSYQRDGGAALRALLAHPDIMQTLAWRMISAEIAHYPEIDHAVGQMHLLRRCSRILASTPPERWDDDINAIVDRIGGDEWERSTLVDGTIREAINWHSAAADTPLSEAEQARARLLLLRDRIDRGDATAPRAGEFDDELKRRVAQLRQRDARDVSPTTEAGEVVDHRPLDASPDRGIERD